MDVDALSSQTLRLAAWFEGLSRPDVERRSFDGGWLTLHPPSGSGHASANANRVYVDGSGKAVTEPAVADWIARFAEAGVQRFHVWLFPGPGREAAREWLLAGGFQPNPWVRYLTLARPPGDTEPARTGLRVRELASADAETAGAALPQIMRPAWDASFGRDGVFHFGAFDGERPVAGAVLAAFEGIGLLTLAGTSESDRRRGAQSALIAARVRKAAALGLRLCVSDTLSILESSLNNLKRAGFEVAYETEVLGWGAAAQG
jgi:hypothetical protein